MHLVQRDLGTPVAFAGPVTDSALQLTQFLGTRTRGLRGLTVVPGAGLGGRVTSEARPAAVNDYGVAESITHEYDDPVLGEGLRAVVAAPVTVRGGVRGVLYAAVRTPEPVGDRATTGLVEIAQRLAAELAIRDEVDHRLSMLRAAATSPPAARSETTHTELLRDLHTELRSIAQDISDVDLRTRLQHACAQLVQLRPDPQPVRAALPEGPSLSPRELDTLSQVALGCSNAQVAERLCLRPETVKAYLRSAMRKLNAHTRHAAVVAAREQGLLP